MVTVADVKSIKVFQGQCDLLQSLEFQKHMAETQGEYNSPLKAGVLKALFEMLNANISDLNERYVTHNEIQAAALLLWKSYKATDPVRLYPEITIVESIMSAEFAPLCRQSSMMRDHDHWQEALDATCAKFENMPASELFALAREQSEKGERVIPSAFVFMGAENA